MGHFDKLRGARWDERTRLVCVSNHGLCDDIVVRRIGTNGVKRKSNGLAFSGITGGWTLGSGVDVELSDEELKLHFSVRRNVFDETLYGRSARVGWSVLNGMGVKRRRHEEELGAN
jgi:hypothetical protein